MKTFKEYVKESDDDTPEGIPKHIWDLHKKHHEAEKKASNWNYGHAKRNATMTFRRLNNAVNKHIPNDSNKQYELLVRMSQETSKREEE